MQLFQTPYGPARREGDELVVLEGPADLIELAMSAEVADASEVKRLPMSGVVLFAPVVPAQIVIVGLNYRSHVEEIGQPVPEAIIFVVSDRVDALGGPGTSIVLPADASERVDYEGEMAIVIGRAASDVDAADAWSYIAGVTAANDVTARDVQRQGLSSGDFTTAKTFPTFKPLGPGLITGSEARGTLSIRTSVNG
ncbi:MAG: hypothetical protein QOH64_1624, partial [Acidimicrobiaceae bacterium]